MQRKFLYKGISFLFVFMTLSFLLTAQQVPRSLTAGNGNFIGFYEYKPTTYTTTKKYPLIIFLHGLGERGNGSSELPAVLVNGVPKEINSGHNMTFTYMGQTETFLVLSPQLSKSFGSWQNFYVDEMLKYAKTNLSIDTNRIYLTGLSLGGGGTWKWATTSAANAKSLAAIAPVCGTCEVVNACNLTNNNVGVWAFHANDDGVVGVGCTKHAEYLIGQCDPANQAIYTYYPNGGHSIWNWTYETDNSIHTPNMYQWFMSKSRANPVNQVPVPRAGNDTVITWPANSVVLNGAGSFDPDGSIISYQWRRVSGPTQFTIASPTQATTTASNLLPGIYQFSLEVRDNQNVSRSDTLYVTVVNNGANQAPVAKAGNDIVLAWPNDSLNVSGWQSFDPDGTIVAYQWAKVSGPSSNILAPNSMTTWIKGMQPGTHVFRLRVTDNQGATGFDTLSIQITGGGVNQVPFANAGADQVITLPTNATTLNASASFDPDGSISAYAWSQISGPSTATMGSPNTVSTTASGLIQGVYIFRLMVQDNGGAQDLDTMRVTVNAAPPPPNVAPIARAGADITIQLPVNSTTLSGAASSDPDGTIVSYQWQQISGGSAVIASAGSVNTGISGLSQGVYGFALTVTDNQAATARDTVMITVLAAAPPPNVAPIARAGADITIQLPVNSTTLSGAASSDPDGTIVGYRWRQLSGPNSARLSSVDSVEAAVENLVEGTYLFELKVVDPEGLSGTDTLSVRVENNLRYDLLLQVFPNPVVTDVQIKLLSEHRGWVVVRVMNTQGQVLISQKVDKQNELLQTSISMRTLRPGIYVVQVLSKDKKIIGVQQVIKQ